MTVGKLKGIIKDIPDNIEIKLSSDTGADQAAEGEIVVEDAYYMNNIFYIYCNESEDDSYASTSDSEI